MSAFGAQGNVIAAVVGSPVAQSLSPAMHNAVLGEQKAGTTYVAVDVRTEDFADLLKDARSIGLRGLSVTMPHKELAFSLMNQCEDQAVISQSVNTIVFEDDGTSFGLNTDGDGACGALVSHGAAIAGARCVVLGAGATARSIVLALDRKGASDISVVNRSVENAQFAASLSNRARVGSVEDIASAAILINATSVGMGTNESPIDDKLLHAGLTVLDVVYYPLETRFLRAATQANAVVVDGLDMLAQQAALQQLAWFGNLPDAGVMRNAAIEELRRRSEAGANK